MTAPRLIRAAHPGEAIARAVAEALEGRRLLSAGDLDPSFGVAGLASLSLGPAAIDYANGKTFIGGGDDWFSSSVPRLDATGRPDPAFGDHGTANPEGIRGPVSALAVLPDNRILAGTGDGIVRLLPNGALDTSFGGDEHTAGFSEPDSLILTGSSKFLASYGGFSVFRYLANGTLDPSFGDAGRFDLYSTFGISIFSGRVGQQPDGKILIVARPDNNQRSVLVARLTANGIPDKSFGGGDGIAFIDAGTRIASADALAVDQTGRIVIATGTYDGYIRPIRLRPDGSLDKRFTRTGFGPSAELESGDVMVVKKVMVGPDGKIIVTGQLQADTSQEYPTYSHGLPSVMARYLPDGTPDRSFGTGLGFAPVRGAIADMLPDGKVVVAGNTYFADPYTSGFDLIGSFAARYQYAQSPDTAPIHLADGKVDIQGSSIDDHLLIRGIAGTWRGDVVDVILNDVHRVFDRAAVKQIRLFAGRGRDFTAGNAFAIPEALYGEADADRLLGGRGADYIHGGSGEDWLLGRDGNDTIDGGNGIYDPGTVEDIYGGNGNDTLIGGDSEDVRIQGGDGNDTLIATLQCSLSGDAGDDVLIGGNPGFYNSSGLDGGPGNDRLVPGLGAERLVGGDGVDTLDYSGRTTQYRPVSWSVR